MAGSGNSLPVSGSYTPFLEALLQDNQPNMLADLSFNVPYPYSSSVPQNPVGVSIPPSTSIIHVPTFTPRANVPPPSLGVQDSTPMITNREKSEAGPSKRPVKRCRNMAELMESTIPSQPRNPTSSPAETSIPFSCGCCHVLREIIHTNGLQYHKLEVHGRIGMICHAVFHQDVQGGSSNPQMFDFGKKNIEEIKQFLNNYCLEQNSLGYVLVSDPLSAYYEALCVGLEWTKTQNELPNSSFPTHTENTSNKGKELMVVNNNPSIPINNNTLVSIPSDSYRSRAEQSFRGEQMSINDLKDFFHLPQPVAARQVRLCKNVLMKICRRGGIKHWPYMKIRSTMKQISGLRKTMSHQDPVSRATIEREIGRLQHEMVVACGGVVPTVALDA